MRAACSIRVRKAAKSAKLLWKQACTLVYEFRPVDAKSLILRCKHMLAAYTRSDSPEYERPPTRPPSFHWLRSLRWHDAPALRDAPLRHAVQRYTRASGIGRGLPNLVRRPRSKPATLSVEPRNLRTQRSPSQSGGLLVAERRRSLFRISTRRPELTPVTSRNLGADLTAVIGAEEQRAADAIPAPAGRCF